MTKRTLCSYKSMHASMTVHVVTIAHVTMATICACVCVWSCVCACVHACMHVCVCVCVVWCGV